MRQGEEPKSVWTPAGGLRMHARVFGEAAPGGPSVILVHGLVVSGRYMVPAAERLAHDRRVFVPDLPGFGLSESPPRASSTWPASPGPSRPGWKGSGWSEQRWSATPWAAR
jgi:pimeloyl-ACP methyl ester carboxylesterase